MRFMSQNAHGFIGCGAAIALIAAPFFFFSRSSEPLFYFVPLAGGVEPFIFFFKPADPMVFYLPIVAGVGLIGYNLLTNNSVRVRRLIPFQLRLVVDLIVVTAFIALPFVFGFGGIERLFYIGFGVLGFFFVLFTKRA